MSAFRWFWILLLVVSLVGAVVACGDDDDDDNDDVTPGDDDDDDDNNDDDDSNDDDTADDDDTTDDDDDDDDDDTAPPDVLDYVDPFIGTGGLAFGYASGYPGPKWPYGLMSLSPDTSWLGMHFTFNHFSGYIYSDTEIRGFTHTHFHGTGAADYGNLMVMAMNQAPGRTISEKNYRSNFIKTNEYAEAGYYAVYLTDPEVKVELTARASAGLHRYTWMGDGDRYLVVNPCSKIEDSWIETADFEIDVPNQTMTGSVHHDGGLVGRNEGVMIYFAMQFSEPFTEHGIWENGNTSSGETSAQGEDVGAYFGFNVAKGEPVLLRVGISFQSVAQAEANLAAEMPDWDLDDAVADNQNAWRDVMGKIELVGGTEQQRRIFYTALYHTHMMPTKWSEPNGKYRGFDEATHDDQGVDYYTDFSLWDTFRTEHPLLFLIEPEESGDMMQSLVRMIEQGGALPQWPAGDGYTGCMIGNSAMMVFAEAYLKGIDGWDVQTAYDAAYEVATSPTAPRGRTDLQNYLDKGYICVENRARGASDALEYYYNDAAMSWWADALGYTADAAQLLAQSQNYVEHFNPETKFMEPRSCDGNFLDGWWRSNVFSEYYVEGNAWHWSFYVPHDPEGFIGLFDNEEDFVTKLDYAFRMGQGGPDNALLPDTYYWFGNEMNMFHNYMFNYTSRPDLAQKYTRWIMEAKFRDEPAGLDGNDDCGTLSAWYVFSSLGFFPLAGSDIYTIGSPLWDGAVLHLPGGDLTISVENNSPENVYVQSVQLNGEDLTEPFFTHDQIVNGGTIDFVMGPNPSTWFAR